MAPKPAVGAAFLLVATLLLAGCIQGKFFAAYIPDGDLQAVRTWSQDPSRTKEGSTGLDPIVKAQWRYVAYKDDGPPPGLIVVIAVSDVPLVDEQKEIDKQVAQFKDQNGISTEETGGGNTQVGSDAATYTLFNAKENQGGTTVDGKAVDIRYTCSANGMAVRLYGLAVVTVNAGVFGQRTSDETWKEVVGTAFGTGGALGGLLSKARCS